MHKSCNLKISFKYTTVPQSQIYYLELQPLVHGGNVNDISFLQEEKQTNKHNNRANRKIEQTEQTNEQNKQTNRTIEHAEQ